jgi:cytochrome P450
VFAICAPAMTTTSTTTAMTLLAWVHHREQFELLRSEPELAPGAIEESLRLHPSGLFVFPRFVAQDTELGGTRLWKEMPLHVCVAAANLDPEVYPNPLEFDIRRNPKHIATFGAGRHFCVGAILARKIIPTSLLAFMRRFPELRLVD